LPKGATIEINMIATSPRWWLGLIMLALAAVIFMPVIARPRAPSWPRTQLSTIPTMLRLQFNAKGADPREIDKKNVAWTFASPTETRLTGKKELKVCEPTQVLFPAGNPRCESAEVPQFSDVANWIVFLSFPQEIAAKDVTVNAHGAALPKWEVKGISNHGAYVYFHGDLTRMVIDFEVIN
jgi:hypothetical protein